MRHVDGVRVAPFGDDVAVTNDDDVRRRVRFQRSNGIGERAGELQRYGDAHVAHIGNLRQVGRKSGLVGERKIDRRLQLRRVESFGFRLMCLPAPFRRNIVHGARKLCGQEHNRDGEQQPACRHRDDP
jgi:hypothetical protein